MDIRQTIERLCGSGAPSGFEGPAAAAARELLEPLMDQVWTDRLGNVIGANILNLLLVIGIPSAVAGIPLEPSTVTMDMPLALLVMAVLLVPILIRKKSSRLQGAALLGIYTVYCVTSFI